jgi:hypothetical protein
MYPIVLFGVTTLVIFIILVAANPVEINQHVFVSLALGFIITFLILYQRAIDSNDENKKNDLNQIFWMFRNV